ncbi:sensor histidine kinase [Streptomyces actinomycinicus]|uniref:Sensor histidine kinase n=1 Tax=Streptomyces actinomycinicus TaxID=1695166 RepID=A0A937EK76_9ACTN|nr:sensor histidine kinase [Streptomyces actinomycinicus]MBL1083489.1 sensor histidine kinase [Streptomyces actinomycinicus]
MTASSPTPLAGAGYRHELYPYSGSDEFVTGALDFIQEALDGDEAVVVAVPQEKASLLRAEIRENDIVRYVDTSGVARHPGRLIAAWQEWIKEHVSEGRPVRGIGESPWDEVRSAAEADELRYHEWLLNMAFAQGPAWWLLCPYDVARDKSALAEMARCHPEIRRDGRTVPCEDYDARAPYAFVALTDPCDPYEEFLYTSGDLPALREKIAACAQQHGLTGRRLRELHLAATEVASNSIRHGGGQGVLRTWGEDRRLVCEFRDAGYLRDPLAGRTMPTARQVGGRGLWLVHQLCDLVEIRSTPDEGTTIRLHTELPE